MRIGNVLKLGLTRIPGGASEKELRTALGRYGTVTSLRMSEGKADVELAWNGSRLIDSAGIGEIPIDGGSIQVKLVRS